jgi:tetratricopeptide (TPR) repeat protein
LIQLYIYLYFNNFCHRLFLKLIVVACFSTFFINNSYAQTAKEHYKSGLAAQKINNHKEAVRIFSTCIDLKPDYTEAYLGRANSNFELKQFDAALPDYIYLYRLTPLNENYIIKSALTYFELKRWADAQNMLMKLESDEINLHIADAKIKMATCKIMLKNFDEALQYLSESISIFPDNDYIYFYKGIASL